MADLGQSFRQFGEDVSNAITGPVKVRLQMAMANRELDAENRKLSAKSELSKSLNPSERTLYEAEGFDSVLGQRKVQVDRIKAANEGSKKDRYLEQFDFFKKMTGMIQTKLDAAQQQVIDAKGTGNEADIAKSMENYNALYGAYDEQVKMFATTLDTDLKKAYALNLAGDGEKVLADMHPDKIDALSETLISGLKNYNGISNEILTELQNTKNAYGVGADLSGIPSSSDVKKYVVTAISNKELNQENANIILNTRDIKQLSQLANDKDRPKSERLLAGALISQYTVFDSIAPELTEKMRGLSDEELSKRASGSDESGFVSKRVSQAASGVLKERGRFRLQEKTNKRTSDAKKKFSESLGN